MKLSKLYCNQPDIFPEINFNSGLNVILGEIRNPDNKDRDTHNLGKTTFVRLVDFCLLKGSYPSAFWKKNDELMNKFVFFLEVENGDEYLTIRRGFERDTKISLKKHSEPNQNFNLEESEWDHKNIAFSNAKEILDGYFDFEIIKPWDFRKIISYLVRIQNDYNDIFRLRKHAGKDVDWKPPLAQILGLDGETAERAYEIDEEINEKEDEVEFLESRLAEFKEDPDKLNGLIQIKKTEVQDINDKLSNFDFKEVEEEIDRDLVSDIEQEISELNDERYYIEVEINQIENSLDGHTKFSVDKSEKIFNEAGIIFGDQIKKSYEDLVEFNEKITTEREKYLKEELKERKSKLEGLDDRLTELNIRRKDALEIIKEKETFDKYKKLNDYLAEQKSILNNLLEKKEDSIKRSDLLKDITKLSHERDELENKMSDELDNPSERYKSIREAYSNVINKVLNQNAVISTQINSAGNYEYNAEYISKAGDSTSKGKGHTYKKLQCIAFDIALIITSLDKQFPHFVIHDGVLETLEDRKRLNLLKLMQEQSDEGMQEIITVIDSHLPIINGERYSFDEDKIIRRLHDSGEEGLLFKMPDW